MTPFPRAIAALYRPVQGEAIPVALIAVDEDQYLAIDEHGTTWGCDEGAVTVVDAGIGEVVFDAAYRVGGS